MKRYDRFYFACYLAFGFPCYLAVIVEDRVKSGAVDSDVAVKVSSKKAAE
jgi:hypothetical protein